jgi:glycosyltransferase involved in cell wall biosynthesis
MKILMLIPSYTKKNIDDDIQQDRHPAMDYLSLQKELDAEIADYTSVDSHHCPVIRFARLFGRDFALAAIGFRNRNSLSAIYSNGENISIPLAFLFLLCKIRPFHALIAHHPSTPKKKWLLRMLHHKMDAIFVYASTQLAYCKNTLKIPDNKLHLIPFHADHRFYRPIKCETERMICSAGLEWRDYPTMIAAVDGLEVKVNLAAASPWSKHSNETSNRSLPANVSARRYEYNELRELYARARIVVVPLYQNDFQAGVTTILEAMAMGKAVIVTRTTGQNDVIIDGVNGVYVTPSDPLALRSAITHLLDNPDTANRLGVNARKTIEESMSLDHWVQRISSVIKKAAGISDDESQIKSM